MTLRVMYGHRSALIVRAVLAISIWLSGFTQPAQGQTPPVPGESIYRQGTLASGQPLRAWRPSGGMATGAEAACVNCHRRSGLGSAEGRFRIPPITGRYLFRPNGRDLEDIDLRYGQQFAPNIQAYSEESLKRAIRDGIGKNGKPLNDLMPRFDLDDGAMIELIGYLKGLSRTSVPGVTDDTLHFATIITPDADPARRQAMLEVLERFFADKNDFIRGGVRPLHSARLAAYRVTRRWQLHVWQLHGPVAGWGQQLREWQATQPVFAVVSGLGGTNWAPVHQFCEETALPCILPNVDLPIDRESDFYPVYYSRGVLLEAQLVVHAATEAGQGRIVQVYREGDIGAEAARQLSTELRRDRRAVEERVLARDAGPAALARVIDAMKPEEQLMLWLRPSDLAALPDRMAAHMPRVYVSGLMGGLEHAPLAGRWRKLVHMTYPYDLPEQRVVRMNFPLAWLNVRHIKVIDERTQSDTWLACRILAESLGDMVDTFVPEYLVEQLENMLGKRLVNGYYPRLSLAPGQRFASKGGYIVHFIDNGTDTLATEGAWIAP